MSSELRKAIIYALCMIALCIGLVGCAGNYQVFDTTYTFNRVQIKMPDGTVISGEVDSWRDFEDGDQLQVTVNGKTYLTSGENVVLIANNE